MVTWRTTLAVASTHRPDIGRRTVTLKNLVYAYINPALRDAVLYELVVASLQTIDVKQVSHLGGLAVLGSAAVVGIALARLRR